MRPVLLIAPTLAVFACVSLRTNEEIRAEEPALRELLDGSQKELAACVYDRVRQAHGAARITANIRDGRGPSTLTASSEAPSGRDFLWWEYRFVQETSEKVLVEFRSRSDETGNGLLPAPISCAAEFQAAKETAGQEARTP